MKVYTAEDCGGELFLVAAWLGLDRASFKELVLDRLEKDSIPEPDRNISELDLCEWDEETFFEFNSPKGPIPFPIEVWKSARFTTLYWTYPGVWSEKRVTRMPAELAAEFWDGEGVEPSDPKHPGWHDRMVGAWDNREKGP